MTPDPWIHLLEQLTDLRETLTYTDRFIDDQGHDKGY